MVNAIKFSTAYSNGYKATTAIHSSAVDLYSSGPMVNVPATAACGFVSFWYSLPAMPAASTFLINQSANTPLYGPFYAGIVGCTAGGAVMPTPYGAAPFQVYFSYIPTSNGTGVQVYLNLVLQNITGTTLNNSYMGTLSTALPADTNWHQISLSWNMGGAHAATQIRVPQMTGSIDNYLITAGLVSGSPSTPTPGPALGAIGVQQAFASIDGGTATALTSKKGLVSLTIGAAGTAYKVGDVLTANGGTSTMPAAIQVLAIGAGGSVTKWQIINPGSYTTTPANNVATTHYTGSGSSNLIVVTSTGSGFTFVGTWSPSGSASFNLNLAAPPVTRWDIGFYPFLNAPYYGNLTQVYVYLSDYYVDLAAELSGAAGMVHNMIGAYPGTANQLAAQLGWTDVSPMGLEFLGDTPCLYLYGDTSSFNTNTPGGTTGGFATAISAVGNTTTTSTNTLNTWASAAEQMAATDMQQAFKLK